MAGVSSGRRSSYFKPNWRYPICVAYHFESGIIQRESHGLLRIKVVSGLRGIARTV